MFERFTWELRATLLGNHARNARALNALNTRARARNAHNARARARDAGTIHIRTSTARPTHTARDARNACNARPTNTAALTHTGRPTQKEPRPRPTGIGDEAGADSAGGRGLTP